MFIPGLEPQRGRYLGRERIGKMQKLTYKSSYLNYHHWGYYLNTKNHFRVVRAIIAEAMLRQVAWMDLYHLESRTVFMLG